MELRNDANLAAQLRKGKDLFRDNLVSLVGFRYPIRYKKPSKFMTYIKGWYKWNDTYGKYSEFGIKKAFDSKTGNVGDINLSLIAALNHGRLYSRTSYDFYPREWLTH